MTRLRRLLLRHSGVAALLLAVALLMKLWVPVGYMPASSGGFALELCAGYAPVPQANAHGGGHHAASGRHGGVHHDEGGAPGAKADMPCAFAALSAPTISSAGAVALLPVPVSTGRATHFVHLARALAPPRHLRPPLRGPPHLA